MNKIEKEDVFVILIAIFVAFLAYNVLVANHTKDLERDKFYASHCREVEQHALSNKYECTKP